MEEDDDFMFEHDILDRVGLEAHMSSDIPTNPKDSRDKFTINVRGVANWIINQGYNVIDQRDIQQMTFKAQLVKHPEYKNPTAFVVGYAILKNNVINKGILNKLTGHFHDFVHPIQATDAIRYANLWLELS